MKKKTKNLLLLITMFVLLLGAYFVLDLLPEKSEEETVTERIEITEFTAEDILSYYYCNAECEMGFTIQDGSFIHYQDAEFPVNITNASAQRSALGELTAMQMVDGTDKGEYGLDVPVITIAVTLSDGTERTFLIGDKALFEDAYYLLDAEKNVIYLVDSGFVSEFEYSRSDMIQQEEPVKISADQIIEVTVETEGQQNVVSYDAAKEYPWQLNLPEGTFDGDSEAVTTALNVFWSYVLGTTIEYNCTDFSVYGLSEPKTRVTVRYTENAETAENEEEQTIKTLVLEFGNTEEDTAVSYVRMNGSSYVYGMSSYYVERLSVFDMEAMKYQPEEEQTSETEDE